MQHICLISKLLVYKNLKTELGVAGEPIKQITSLRVNNVDREHKIRWNKEVIINHK